MAVDENKALLRRFFADVWNKGDYSFIEEVYSPDFVLHPLWPNPAAGNRDDVPGRDGAKEVIVAWRDALPDLEMAVHDVVAEGDKVGMRHTVSGTHAREFQGIPPTNRTGRFKWMTLTRVSNGKIVEAWTSWDAFGMLTQLGVVPKWKTILEFDEAGGAQADGAATASGQAAGSGGAEDEERNKQTMRRFWEELWNDGRFDLAKEIVDPQYADHGLTPGPAQRGPDAASDGARQFRTAFPDLVMQVDDMLAEQNRVMTRWTATGTHRGPLGRKKKPTGKRTRIRGLTITHLANGRVVEGWHNFDQLGMAFELGVLPSPESLQARLFRGFLRARSKVRR
jgi:steroid delta-isomerase-like uncharacterized protein